MEDWLELNLVDSDEKKKKINILHRIQIKSRVL